MTDTTHSPVCWGWGPKHHECAVGQVERDEVRVMADKLATELAACDVARPRAYLRQIGRAVQKRPRVI